MIYLYDLSAMIASGTESNTGANYGKPRNQYNYYSFPTGGLYKFNECLISDIKSMKKGDSIVVCVDGKFNKLFRKQAYDNYKGNRKITTFDDAGVSLNDEEAVQALINTLTEAEYTKVARRFARKLQIDVLLQVLPKIGVNVLYHENLEADDLIYSVCYKYGKDNDIFLRADDSDLDDCLYYCPTLRKYSLSGRKELYPVVGRNFSKIFDGEVSDNIPRLYNYVDYSNLDALRRAIVQGLEPVTTLADPTRLSAYGFNEEEIKAIMLNNYLVNPIIYDVNINETEINYNELHTYLSAFRFKNALKRVRLSVKESEEVKDLTNYAFSILPTFVKKFYSRYEYKDVKTTPVDNTVKDNTENLLNKAKEFGKL